MNGRQIWRPFSLYFCAMKWIGKRISFVDNQDKTTVIITPETVGIYKALIGAWFFMWITAGLSAIWAYNTFEIKKGMENQLQIIFFIFIAFWVYYTIRVGRTFFWLLWGKEYLKIDKISMTIKTSIRNYGKAKEFFIENISKIKVSVPEKKSFQQAYENTPWIRGGERLEFEYQGKVIRFGRKLDEQEAKQLFQLITSRIDSHLKMKRKNG